MKTENITPHFKWSEFIRPQDGKPDLHILKNIRRLAQALELVRVKLGNRAILITSGYRTPEHNAEVGGEPNSYHLFGMAADLTVKGLTPWEVWTDLKDWSGGMGIYDTWIHLDIRSPLSARWDKRTK